MHDVSKESVSTIKCALKPYGKLIALVNMENFNTVYKKTSLNCENLSKNRYLFLVSSVKIRHETNSILIKKAFNGI